MSTLYPYAVQVDAEASGAGAIGIKVIEVAELTDCRGRGTNDLVLDDDAYLFVAGMDYRTIAIGADATLEPRAGDRAVYDAAAYPSRHTNDADTATGLHHTLTALDDRFQAAPHGWLTPWRYRFAVTIDNAGTALTDADVPIDVNTAPLVEAGQCNADLSDLRVTSSDGVSLLPFYRANEALAFNQTNFVRHTSNPVIVSGADGTWDHGWIHPYSIVDHNGTLYLYYGGHPTPGDSNIPNKIGLATSSDGVTWTKHASNPILSPGSAGQWDEIYVEHFQVVRESATSWRAWYAGQSGGVWRIGYATSSDGVTWTKYGSNPILTATASAWDSALILPCNVWVESNVYYMIYWGGTSNGDQTTWKIGLATSPDGFTWTKHASNPVFEGASGEWDAGVLDCAVIKLGDTYVMFYQGNTTSGANSAIGRATSPDLITWTRDADNPMPRGSTGTWDTDWNEGPVIARVGAAWHVYYMGKDSSVTKSIGLLRFPDTRLWVTVPTVPAADTAIFVYYGNSLATDVSTGSAGSVDPDLTITNGAEDTPDLAAWDDVTWPAAHARDIEVETFTYHTDPANPPLTSIPASGVTPGSYTNLSATIGADGRITAASNGAPIGQYRQFAYVVTGGDFSFVIDGDGRPVMVLQDLE